MRAQGQGQRAVNYKLLFPTYRTRALFVREELERLGRRRGSRRMLHVGSGEGELDPLLAAYTERLDACDVNARDVDYARSINRQVSNVRYAVEHGEKLSYGSACFDTVICLEVIEHVADPQAVLGEVARVLEPGGTAIFTFPSYRFPLVYDPLNRVLQRLGHPLSVGAYAYGHRWLVREGEMDRWLAEQAFEVCATRHLSHHLAALVECYVPGLMQKLLKANASNDSRGGRRGPALRPTANEPPFVSLTDALIRLDEWLFSGGSRSVGLGYVTRRPSG